MRWFAACAVGIGMAGALATPVAAARPVASGSFVTGWEIGSPTASTCSLAIDYAWQYANGIDRATVRFQMKTPTATEWSDVGSLSSYDPRMRVPRTYSYTAGLTVPVSGTQHVFRALGQTYNHRDEVITGTEAISVTSAAMNCG